MERVRTQQGEQFINGIAKNNFMQSLLLLQKGDIDLEKSDKHGWTALHRLAWKSSIPENQAKLYDVLVWGVLSRTQNLHPKEEEGRTPKDLASIRHNNRFRMLLNNEELKRAVRVDELFQSNTPWNR